MLTTIRGGFTQFIPAVPTAYAKALHKMFIPPYYEDKGKPAMKWNFLKQYVGKSPSDPLTLGKDIDAVSGATWTSTSVTFAVKKAVVIVFNFI